jgi:PBP1b-binding outer membrane lipoprotein LpoB
MIKKILLYCMVVLFFVSCSNKSETSKDTKDDTNKTKSKTDSNITEEEIKEKTFAEDMQEMEDDMAELYLKHNRDFFPKGF